MTAGDAEKETDNLREAQDKLAESNDRLVGSYDEIASGVGDFFTKIQSAGSIFDNFNENILISDEKKQQLSDNMNSVQEEITAICRLAADERRKLTETEILRLDELFQRMHELADQELAIEQQKQGVVTSQAEALNNAADISFEQYIQRAQKLANSAEKTRDAVIEKAYEQYSEEIALLNWRLENDKDFSQQEYDQKVKAAEEQYQAVIDAANKEAADTLDILVQGYTQRASALTTSSNVLAKIQRDIEKEDERHAKVLADNERQYQKQMAELAKENLSASTRKAREQEALRLKEKNEESALTYHNKRMAELRNEQAKILDDENYQNQLKGFLTLCGLYETYSGQMHTKSQGLVNAFFEPMKGMGEDIRKNFQDLMKGALGGIADYEETLIGKAKSIQGSITSVFTKGWEIKSPSRKFKRIFKYTLQGGEKGLDEEAPKLFEKEDEIAQTFTKKLQVGVSTEGLISKLRAGIAEGRAFVAQALTAKVVHDVNVNTEDANRTVMLKGDIVTHMDIDGREFAVATAPYMSEELTWNGGVA